MHALRKYEFAMRVDDDVIVSGMRNVLDVMRSREGVYGYALWTVEKHAETVVTMTPPTRQSILSSRAPT